MKTVNIPDPVMSNISSNTIAFQGLLERSLKLQKRIEDGITEKNNNLQN